MPSYYLSEDLARFGDISKTNPQLFDLFLKWYSATMEPGALDGKTKKLIAYAVANAIQEPYCIDSYASACADAGISPEELAEALNVAAVIRGGGSIAHWAQTLNTIARKK
jgi:alkylhydroperoxidase/carboxymuconolactone decarboxylase family protein